MTNKDGKKNVESSEENMVSIFDIKSGSKFKAPSCQDTPYSKDELKKANAWWKKRTPHTKIAIYRDWSTAGKWI